MSDFFYAVTWAYIMGFSIVLLFKFIQDTEPE